MSINKFKQLQIRALQALKYALKLKKDNSGNLYTRDDLAKELNVTKSLIDQIINGRRAFPLPKIEEIERITKILIFTVNDPKELQCNDINQIILEKEEIDNLNEPITSMEGNFKSFDFFTDILRSIKSEIESKHPNVFVEKRDTSQYVSLNVYGSLVKETINKGNLHLLFFKRIKYKGETLYKERKIHLKNGDFQFKIEYMISDIKLNELISNKSWYNDVQKFHATETISASDRSIYKINNLSTSEIESFGKLSLAVFEIRTDIFNKTDK